MSKRNHYPSAALEHDGRFGRANALDQLPKVRGRPFQLGNPGRPLGSKNKTTRLVEQLVEGDAEKLSRKMIELAKAGNVRCLEYCLDRILPRRSGRSLDIQLPAINTVHDVLLAMDTIARAVSAGDLSGEEASHLVHFLESYERTIITTDFAIRLEKLESRMKKKIS